MSAQPLRAPFPYFGGKREAAALVWSALGRVQNYVEPFFGSGAVLLGRPPGWRGNETVNDLDGMVANFWRAVKADPAIVAEHADIWHGFGDAETLAHKHAVLDRWCERVGRDPSEIVRSAGVAPTPA